MVRYYPVLESVQAALIIEAEKNRILPRGGASIKTLVLQTISHFTMHAIVYASWMMVYSPHNPNF